MPLSLFSHPPRILDDRGCTDEGVTDLNDGFDELPEVRSSRAMIGVADADGEPLPEPGLRWHSDAGFLDLQQDFAVQIVERRLGKLWSAIPETNYVQFNWR